MEMNSEGSDLELRNGMTPKSLVLISDHELVYKTNSASQSQIHIHLKECSDQFVPPLHQKVNLEEYSRKLFTQATRFEAWDDHHLVGLVAAYLNDHEKNQGYITSVSTAEQHSGKGVASSLMNMCIQHARKKNFKEIKLEVSQKNQRAIQLYQKFNFTAIEVKNDSLIMKHDIGEMNSMRDYNKEFLDTSDHKYAYNFDFDVMHPFMVTSFLPYFKKGNLLELGSFKGDFTKRLLPYFDDITCVEASEEAIAVAKEQLGSGIKFIKAVFETADLPEKYDNIVMTHVLEHLDDPVAVLKRINDEWLSDTGRFFLVCPNANAPSRQIAVKMGLISHNTAVTPAEKEHGHRITYSLDTLERDARAGGLRVVHRTGIFFKALANFQWDRLLKTDIISHEYLEGCYQLGQQYPDLCSSIFLMCEKGN
jgi:ribosomal protein S18 acetylase RimI-like enzyme/SAM-dependent methyltransferase